MPTLDALLTPSSVAVIGASRTPGKVGHEVVHSLIAGGFEGDIIPVNPSAESVEGLPCYKSLSQAARKIDLAVIAVPACNAHQAVVDAIAAEAKAVAVISAGFRELDAEGAERERELARYCKAHGARLLGPNCLGVINTAHKLNASFAHQMPPPGGISVVSQSGALCTAILDWAVQEGFGLAKLVSIGNKADLKETDLFQALADDPQTQVIACYLESLDEGDTFVRIAERVSAQKPIVVLKAGTTESGSKAATSHTGSLSGADVAYGAAFRRAGVVRVGTFEDLLDACRAFAMQPLPKGRRVAIITNAGGPGIMAADAAETRGLKAQELEHANAAALRERLPRAASVSNPIDVLGDADPARYEAAFTAALDDDSVDAVVVLLTPQAMTAPKETAERLIAQLRGNKPVLAAFMGGRDVLPAREAFVRANLPSYPSPERAVAALHAMVRYSEWRDRPPRVLTRIPVNKRRVERIIARHHRAGWDQVGEVEAKDILRAYEFHVLEGRIARSAEEAVAVADHVGYPVAMKIVSPQLIHKSDIGGVRLGLGDPERVRDAYDLMMLRIAKKAPDATLLGVYVEAMSKPGREVILGMHRDPQFGPMLMFGLGGIFVEVMQDVSFHLAPITEDEAVQMLQSTRSYALLTGARGGQQVDIQAVARCLQRVSQLVTDFPVIQEMDINPLVVGEEGVAPIVADARMTLDFGGKANA